jgi:hypothetical protein
MTHFVGAVVVPAEVPTGYTTKTVSPGPFEYTRQEANNTLNEYLTTALERFDENFEVPRFQEYSRSELIANVRAEVKSYADGTYAKYLADPEAYAADCRNLSHLLYLRDEFPKRLTWTDDECYADGVKYYDDEDVAADGGVWTAVNPQGKWDWWTVGGRWEKQYAERQGETVAALLVGLNETLAALDRGDQLRPAPTEGGLFEDADRKLPWWFPQNIVTPDGDSFVWSEQHKVGWFGMHAEGLGESDWIRQIITLAEALPQDSTVVYIDFHV